MEIRKNLMELKRAIGSDEDMLRLLFYAPENSIDNPLSPKKENIIGGEFHKEILEDRIMLSPKTSDLRDKEIVRICMYLGHANYIESTHQLVFDIYTHIDKYDSLDMRSAWIFEKLGSILFENQSESVEKIDLERSMLLRDVPKGYAGHRIIFSYEMK